MHLMVVLLGLAYGDVCQSFSGSFDFSYGYIQRHQTPPSLLQRLDSVLPVSNITSECCAFLDDFANEASSFIRCTIERSRPLRFCEQCVIPYERVTTVFNDIMRVSCIYILELLVEVNRLGPPLDGIHKKEENDIYFLSKE